MCIITINDKITWQLCIVLTQVVLYHICQESKKQNNKVLLINTKRTQEGGNTFSQHCKLCVKLNSGLDIVQNIEYYIVKR